MIINKSIRTYLLVLNQFLKNLSYKKKLFNLVKNLLLINHVKTKSEIRFFFFFIGTLVKKKKLLFLLQNFDSRKILNLFLKKYYSQKKIKSVALGNKLGSKFNNLAYLQFFLCLNQVSTDLVIKNPYTLFLNKKNFFFIKTQIRRNYPQAPNYQFHLHKMWQREEIYRQRFFFKRLFFPRYWKGELKKTWKWGRKKDRRKNQKKYLKRYRKNQRFKRLRRINYGQIIYYYRKKTKHGLRFKQRLPNRRIPAGVYNLLSNSKYSWKKRFVINKKFTRISFKFSRRFYKILPALNQKIFFLQQKRKTYLILLQKFSKLFKKKILFLKKKNFNITNAFLERVRGEIFSKRPFQILINERKLSEKLTRLLILKKKFRRDAQHSFYLLRKLTAQKIRANNLFLGSTFSIHKKGVGSNFFRQFSYLLLYPRREKKLKFFSFQTYQNYSTAQFYLKVLFRKYKARLIKNKKNVFIKIKKLEQLFLFFLSRNFRQSLFFKKKKNLASILLYFSKTRKNEQLVVTPFIFRGYKYDNFYFPLSKKVKIEKSLLLFQQLFLKKKILNIKKFRSYNFIPSKKILNKNFYQTPLPQFKITPGSFQEKVFSANFFMIKKRGPSFLQFLLKKRLTFPLKYSLLFYIFQKKNFRLFLHLFRSFKNFFLVLFKVPHFKILNFLVLFKSLPILRLRLKKFLRVHFKKNTHRILKKVKNKNVLGSKFSHKQFKLFHNRRLRKSVRRKTIKKIFKKYIINCFGHIFWRKLTSLINEKNNLQIKSLILKKSKIAARNLFKNNSSKKYLSLAISWRHLNLNWPKLKSYLPKYYLKISVKIKQFVYRQLKTKLRKLAKKKQRAFKRRKKFYTKSLKTFLKVGRSFTKWKWKKRKFFFKKWHYKYKSFPKVFFKKKKKINSARIFIMQDKILYYGSFQKIFNLMQKKKFLLLQRSNCIQTRATIFAELVKKFPNSIIHFTDAAIQQAFLKKKLNSKFHYFTNEVYHFILTKQKFLKNDSVRKQFKNSFLPLHFDESIDKSLHLLEEITKVTELDENFLISNLRRRKHDSKVIQTFPKLSFLNLPQKKKLKPQLVRITRKSPRKPRKHYSFVAQRRSKIVIPVIKTHKFIHSMFNRRLQLFLLLIKNSKVSDPFYFFTVKDRTWIPKTKVSQRKILTTRITEKPWRLFFAAKKSIKFVYLFQRQLAESSISNFRTSKKKIEKIGHTRYMWIRFRTFINRLIRHCQYSVYRRKKNKLSRTVKFLNRNLKKRLNRKLSYENFSYETEIKRRFKIRKAKRLKRILQLKFRFQIFFKMFYNYKTNHKLFKQINQKYNKKKFFNTINANLYLFILKKKNKIAGLTENKCAGTVPLFLPNSVLKIKMNFYKKSLRNNLKTFEAKNYDDLGLGLPSEIKNYFEGTTKKTPLKREALVLQMFRLKSKKDKSPVKFFFPKKDRTTTTPFITHQYNSPKIISDLYSSRYFNSMLKILTHKFSKQFLSGLLSLSKKTLQSGYKKRSVIHKTLYPIARNYYNRNYNYLLYKKLKMLKVYTASTNMNYVQLFRFFLKRKNTLRSFAILESQLSILLYRMKFVPSLTLLPKLFFYNLVFLNNKITRNPFLLVNLYELIQVPYILTKKFYFYTTNADQLRTTTSDRMKYFMKATKAIYHPSLNKIWLPTYFTANLTIASAFLHSHPTFEYFSKPFASFTKPNRNPLHVQAMGTYRQLSNWKVFKYQAKKLKRRRRHFKKFLTNYCLVKLNFFSFLDYYNKY